MTLLTLSSKNTTIQQNLQAASTIYIPIDLETARTPETRCPSQLMTFPPSSSIREHSSSLFGWKQLTTNIIWLQKEITSRCCRAVQQQTLALPYGQWLMAWAVFPDKGLP